VFCDLLCCSLQCLLGSFSAGTYYLLVGVQIFAVFIVCFGGSSMGDFGDYYVICGTVFY